MQVWMGDEREENLKGNCMFYLVNKTDPQVCTPPFTPRGSKVVSGKTAEWVMERPTRNPGTAYESLAELANYDSATMILAYAEKSNRVNGWRPTTVVYYSSMASGYPNIQLPMKNESDEVLSAVTSIDIDTMRFCWKAFH
jgi:hypothetical protein